ncbi:Uncharacterized protein GBIM_13891 [Gryllus bimaculatus]|nr:Uncharacterized protein GBIM_13891 [Gryllus bimaculatus]
MYVTLITSIEWWVPDPSTLGGSRTLDPPATHSARRLAATYLVLGPPVRRVPADREGTEFINHLNFEHFYELASVLCSLLNLLGSVNTLGFQYPWSEKQSSSFAKPKTAIPGGVPYSQQYAVSGGPCVGFSAAQKQSSAVGMLAVRPWLLVLVALAAGTARADDDVKVSIAGDDVVSSGMRVFMKVYNDCARKEYGLSGCLKMKAITFFDRAARAAQIPLADNLVLVKKAAAVAATPPAGRSLTEADVEAALPRGAADADARDLKLDNILLDSVARFFNSHTVQIDFPKMEGTQLQRGIEEGRGKMKKMMNMMMMGVAMKLAGLIPLAIAGLFVLAGKAFIVSKIALVLALIIALKKILSQKQGGGHEMNHGGWQGGGGGGGWDRRSFDAHDMAFRGQKPVAA